MCDHPQDSIDLEYIFNASRESIEQPVAHGAPKTSTVWTRLADERVIYWPSHRSANVLLTIMPNLHADYRGRYILGVGNRRRPSRLGLLGQRDLLHHFNP